ncbi:MAG: Mur ligase family protein, partial [Patescibacteria group bacterium]
MDASAHFRDKRITLMGLGLLGRGVGDARYLAECGTELIVTDLKPRGELAESVTQLESFKNITFVLGQHRLEDFKNKDLILKAAGVPLDSIYIAEAKKNDIPVRMSADLFAELSGVACVGITGTRGKSTVAQMIYEILKASGKKVLLGGNMRGISTLALLKEVTSGHIAVLELDSWQLQGWGEARMSPHIAVFTTLYQDHLNYYGSTSLTTRKEHPEQYLADKANIFLYQKPEDTLILGAQCAPTIIDKYGENIEATTLVVDETKLPDTWVLRIPGIHNRYDAALALAAARAMDISDGDWVRRNFERRSWEWIDRQHFVCRERMLSADGTRLVCREVVTHAERGVLVDQFYAERLYSREQLHALLRAAGLGRIRDHGTILSGSDRNQDLGMMSHRIFVTASEPVATLVPVPRRIVYRPQFPEVTVILGDPRLADTVKYNGKFQPEDHTAVHRLKAALESLPGYRFRYLDCHATLASDLRRRRPAFVLNFC